MARRRRGTRALWLASIALVTAVTGVARAASPASCSAWPDCFYPLLADESAGESRSVGDAVHGFLVAGRRLYESDKISVLPSLRAREFVFGTAELIHLIEHAASSLHHATGTKLWVGNLSRPGGGDIQHSVSHNSGRDADLAFCYLDKKGQPVDPSSFDPVRGNGRSAAGRRFDVARNWLVVKALLTANTAAEVQFIFVAAWLKRNLLEHARATHEPAALVLRAHDVLQHPVGSAAHDDHFHVRIYCSERDVVSGCVDGSDARSAQPRHPHALASRIRAASHELGAADSDRRERAIERLVLLRARSEGAAIARLLDDPMVEVRFAAALGLGWLGREGDAHELSARAQVEPVPAVKHELRLASQRARGAGTQRLSSFGANADGYLLRAALYGARLTEERLVAQAADPSEIDRARARLLGASEAAVRAERTEPLEPLLDLLLHPTPTIRVAAAHALAMIANHQVLGPWSTEPADSDALLAAATSWRKWIRAHGHGGRNALVWAGFRAGRYRYEPHAPQSLYELARALTGADHHARNAESLLVRLTMHHAPDHPSKAEACKHWRDWIVGHRSRFRVGMPVQPLSCES